MVAMPNGLVHFRPICLDVWTHQNVVKAKIHPASIVTDAWSVSTLCICIIQKGRQTMVDI